MDTHLYTAVSCVYSCGATKRNKSLFTRKHTHSPIHASADTQKPRDRHREIGETGETEREREREREDERERERRTREGERRTRERERGRERVEGGQRDSGTETKLQLN